MTRQDLDRHQADGVASLLAQILPGHPFYARKLADFSLSRLSFPRDFQRLPFTTRAELLQAQLAHPPHGGLISFPFERYTRMHQTSGTSSGVPLRWYDTPESWNSLLDGWIEKLQFGGITARDTFFFPFSFGPFLGFWSAFEAGTRMGCRSLPGGGMSSSARLRFLIENKATVVFCTPTYALRLLEVAQQDGIDLISSPVRALVVAGEPGGSITSTRARIESGWGARVFDHNGMTETGPLGFECLESPASLTLLETAILPEVVDPEGRPVTPGTPGELVVTSFRRVASPLIRYRTGDVVCVDPAPCPSGRAMMRLKQGITGRADEMIVVRGNNLHPAALQAIMHRIEGLAEYLVEIDDSGTMTEVRVLVEPTTATDGVTLANRVDRAIRDALLFRVEVRAVEPGRLPRAEMKAKRWIRKSLAGDAPLASGA
ncbi:MAG: phenylacetate--CoA ligase family protein [Planctomycetia bacterium]|nr:phenylacetate--CoA ligase family protein [Planctomycetia bacterium]